MINVFVFYYKFFLIRTVNSNQAFESFLDY